VESTGEPRELTAKIPTGTGGKALTVRASSRIESDPNQRTLPRAWQILPWVPAPTPLAAAAPPLPFALAGGDRRRGEAVFTSDEAKCSTCHKVRGLGGDIGPDLGALVGRDPAEVYRDIAEPNVVIKPEYVRYTVALKDGRVAVGIVRAEGADTIRVLDTDGKETRFPRSEVEELRASGTSIMPVGLAGALGKDKMRDLLAFLVTPPPGADATVAHGATPTTQARFSSAANPRTMPGAPTVAALPKLALAVAFPDLRFDRPVAMAYPDDGSNLLFIVEQRGVIRSFPNEPSTSDEEVFFDIRSRVLSPASGGDNEEGLLGLAFHPKYRDNGAFFVYFSAKEGPSGRRSVVSRFKVSRTNPRKADPASEKRIWISAPDPYGNHNGGCILFGPDGYLYITLGDSGSADDPLTTGQNPRDWFGSILRIDVDHPSGGKPYGIPKDNPALRDTKFSHWAPEVYAIGLRNAWKITFDRQTGRLWAGDVGQNLWESVHIIENGGNYGWSIMEGFHPFRPRQQKDPASPLTKPIIEYPHNPNQAGSRRTDYGQSITGGYVYRGRDLPKLVGVYIYGDYETGRIWGLREQEGRAIANGELIDMNRGPRLNIAAFGEDPAGELYILAFDGRIYHLVLR
jgi:putative heme-binding domain-containing protein